MVRQRTTSATAAPRPWDSGRPNSTQSTWNAECTFAGPRFVSFLQTGAGGSIAVPRLSAHPVRNSAPQSGQRSSAHLISGGWKSSGFRCRRWRGQGGPLRCRRAVAPSMAVRPAAVARPLMDDRERFAPLARSLARERSLSSQYTVAAAQRRNTAAYRDSAAPQTALNFDCPS